MIKEKKEQLKEIKKKAKARALKEMYFSCGIDMHDIQIKMNKVTEFLADSHPVKIVVMAKKKALTKNPLAIEELTLKIVELVGDRVVNIQQPTGPTPLRKDFILNPKVVADDK